MANQAQLAILKQGVGVWNKWREENPEEPIDLSGADLLEADLSNANLLSADLSMAELNGANLSRADLCSANLDKANVRSGNLRQAVLRGASLITTDLAATDLRDANLEGAHLDGAILFYADLSGADLSEAGLSGADLGGANLSRAYLSGADLGGANVNGLIYDRESMPGRYCGIRVDNCYGDAIFKRDAQDQDYIDTVGTRCTNWYGKMKLAVWGWTDYGRSIFRVGLSALILVMIFGTIYKLFPHLVDYGKHHITPFTPYYFSFVTYTTLGFGDVTAGCLAGEILVALEVVLGYLTLGLLLAILANTVARRS